MKPENRLSDDDVARMIRAALADEEKSVVETAIRIYYLGRQHGMEQLKSILESLEVKR